METWTNMERIYGSPHLLLKYLNIAVFLTLDPRGHELHKIFKFWNVYVNCIFLRYFTVVTTELCRFSLAAATNYHKLVD